MNTPTMLKRALLGVTAAVALTALAPMAGARAEPYDQRWEQRRYDDWRREERRREELRLAERRHEAWERERAEAWRHRWDPPRSYDRASDR